MIKDSAIKRQERLWTVLREDDLVVRSSKGMEIKRFKVKDLENQKVGEFIKAFTLEEYFFMIRVVRFKEDKDKERCAVCNRSTDYLEDEFFEFTAGFHKISQKEYKASMKDVISKHGSNWQFEVKQPKDQCPSVEVCWSATNQKRLGKAKPFFWKLMRGLNILAKCSSEKCKSRAFGSVVVMNRGTEDNQIDMNELDLRCLLCREQLLPENLLSFIFLACDWKLQIQGIEGTKSWSLKGTANSFTNYESVEITQFPSGSRSFKVECCDCWASIC